MMVRHYEIDFNSGALVFPGGSVDKGDQEIIDRPELYSGGEGLDAADLSFRIAAIRETFEESGILLARPRGIEDPDRCEAGKRDRSRHRTALCEGKTTFQKVLADNGMLLALDLAGALRALDHAGGHAEAVRHLVLPGGGAAGAGRRP